MLNATTNRRSGGVLVLAGAFMVLIAALFVMGTQPASAVEQTTTTTTTAIEPSSQFVRVTAMCLEIDGPNEGLYKFRVRHEPQDPLDLADVPGPWDYTLNIGGTVHHSGTIAHGETQYVWLSPPKLGVSVQPAGPWTNEYGGTASSNDNLCESTTTTTTTTLPSAFVRVTAMCLEIDGPNEGLYKFRVRHEPPEVADLADVPGPFDYTLNIGGTVHHSGTIAYGETQYVWLDPPKLGVSVQPAGPWTNEYGGTASSNDNLCESTTTTTVAGPSTTTTTVPPASTTTAPPASTTTVAPASTTTVAGPSTLPNTGGSGPLGSGTPIGFSLAMFVVGGLGLVLVGSGLVVITAGRERETSA